MSFSPPTILRLPSPTSAMLIAKPSCVMPNSLLRRKYDATFALWMMFLLGKHAMFEHDPPRICSRRLRLAFLPQQKSTQRWSSPCPPENHQIKFLRLRLLNYLSG